MDKNVAGAGILARQAQRMAPTIPARAPAREIFLPGIDPSGGLDGVTSASYYLENQKIGKPGGKGTWTLLL
jgi:hypothetical protein